MLINWLILFALLSLHMFNSLKYMYHMNGENKSAKNQMHHCWFQNAVFTAWCSSSTECHTHDFSVNIYSRLRISIASIVYPHASPCLIQYVLFLPNTISIHIFGEQVLWMKYFALQKVVCLRGGVQICK